MPTVNLGRVKAPPFVPRGAWDSGTAYVVNDLTVAASGDTFVAVADNTAEDPDAALGSWVLFAAGGEAGTPGSDATVNATNVASVITGATEKTTPVNADQLAITDSAASDALKRLTFANLWAWILIKLIPQYGLVINSTTPRTRTTLDTYADDEDLYVALDAASCYYFEFVIFCKNSVSGGSNFGTRAKLYYGGALGGGNYENGAIGLAPTVNIYMRFPTVTAGSTSEALSSFISGPMKITGILQTSTAGTFSLQTANARASSTMTRIAGTLLIRKL